MTQFVEKPAIIALKVRVRPEQVALFADWQAKMNGKIALQPGFVSLEFISPTKNNPQWVVAQRFGTQSQSSDWKRSSAYQELYTALKDIAETGGIEEVSAEEVSLNNGVTEVIIAEVFPERKTDYRDWIAKIHSFEAQYPGFRGVYIQSPTENKGKFWITLLQFDSMQNLDNWLSSPERQNLLRESKSMVSHLESHRMISPYAGWFGSIAKVGEIPPLWKQTMLILLVLFPIVMLEFKFLNPWTKSLNISLGTFIGNAISVSLISFPALPTAIYFLRWWLSPKDKHNKWVEFGGTALVLALYLLEIYIFWSFV